MGLSRMNIWLRDANCTPMTTVWRADLAIITCGGKYLVDFYPEILKQLSDRYGTVAYVDDLTNYPITDQTGLTEFVTIGTTAQQTVNFSSPATNAAEIANQMNSQLTGCEVKVVDGRVRIITDDQGPEATITVGGGTCSLVWGVPIQGTGYRVRKLVNYQNATRISIQPPAGQMINHIELDVPPGCYKVWCRCCFGNNEETNKVMVNLCCDDHACVNLLLNAVKTCTEDLIHPAFDRVVNDANYQIEEEIVPFMKQMMWLGVKSKATLVAQLNERLIEAQDKGDTELEARINAVLTIVNTLPDCQ